MREAANKLRSNQMLTETPQYLTGTTHLHLTEHQTMRPRASSLKCAANLSPTCVSLSPPKDFYAPALHTIQHQDTNRSNILLMALKMAVLFVIINAW